MDKTRDPAALHKVQDSGGWGSVHRPPVQQGSRFAFQVGSLSAGILGITVGCWGTELGPPPSPAPSQQPSPKSNLHHHLHSRRFGTPGTGKDRQGSWATGVKLSSACQICRQSTLIMVPERCECGDRALFSNCKHSFASSTFKPTFRRDILGFRVFGI